MQNFREISFTELNIHPYTAIAEEWMLITAGNEERGYNTMTASWGHLGSIWGHGGGLPTSVIFIRPQRFTKEFVDREEYYTLSFFEPEYKKALGYLGSHSGRDEDKVAAAGLTPVFLDDTTTCWRKVLWTNPCWRTATPSGICTICTSAKSQRSM